ncbi:serine/threonine-protein kinase [Streptomyces acidiscabies]|uniref:serine/threonine-protein kinase n=1 Tax=Streptomyces acidiscabies TaxID=42234 RepID=UPI0030D544CC
MSDDRGAGDDGDGLIVGGRYRLLGGTGVVQRAWDVEAGREVAVKAPRVPGVPGGEEFRRAAHRLYQEARAAARVEHPGAVVIHDVVVEGEDQLPWVVMELVEGESLAEALERGPLGVVEAARVGGVVLGALRAAHAVGIVHRDVRPEHVLLGVDGRVVVTDFGIAHGYEDGGPVRELEFAAPERAAGGHAGAESDLWSLGVLLYAAVEGVSPFRRGTAEETLAAVLAGEVPEPVRAGRLGVLLSGLLVKEPGERMGAGEVEEVLRAVSGSGAEGSAQGGVVPEGDAREERARGVVPEAEAPEDRTRVVVPESEAPDEPARVVVAEDQSEYGVQEPARRRPFPLSLFFG